MMLSLSQGPGKGEIGNTDLNTDPTLWVSAPPKQAVCDLDFSMLWTSSDVTWGPEGKQMPRQGSCASLQILHPWLLTRT